MDDIPRPSELGSSIEEQAKLMRAYRIQVPSLLPPAQLLPQIPPSPVGVLTFILSFIPGKLVPRFALLSHDFLSAAQTVLYGNLDMQDVRNPNAVWNIAFGNTCLSGQTKAELLTWLDDLTNAAPPPISITPR
ncbi:hypothetical protein EDD85DRAFT_1027345 [Armillaria nabsnona]|nr:hypothetical protein EDD85DRAFT_1027345 [Armillaria nabsnona]